MNAAMYIYFHVYMYINRENIAYLNWPTDESEATVIVLKLIWDIIYVFGEIGVNMTDSGYDEVICISSQWFVLRNVLSNILLSTHRWLLLLYLFFVPYFN